MTLAVRAGTRSVASLSTAATLGVGAGFACALVAQRRAEGVVALVLVIGAVAWCAGWITARQALLGAIVVDVPLQLGGHLFYDDDAAAIGALGGLEISVTTLALAGLYGLWAIDLLTGDSAPRPHLASCGPLLVYLAATAGSVVVADRVALAAFGTVALTQIALVFVYLIHHVRSESELGLLGTMITAALLVEAIIVLLAAAGGPQLLPVRMDADVRGDRFGGTVGSPNAAGSFFAAFLPIAVAVAAFGRTQAARMLAALSALAGAGALFMTVSRGSVLNAAIGVTTVLVVAKRRSWISATQVATLVLAGALVVVALAPQVSALGGDDTGAAASRVPLARLASELIYANPLLGVGINNVGSEIRDLAGPPYVNEWIYTVHHKFLLVWAEAGVVALAAFCAFLIQSLRAAARATWERTTATAALGAGALGALLGAISQMTVEPYQSRPQMQGLVIVAAIATSGAARG